jgi:hypothetical protein
MMKNMSKPKVAPLVFLPLLLLIFLSSCGTAAGSDSDAVSGGAGAAYRAGSRSAGSAFSKTALNRRFSNCEYDGKDPVEKLVYDTENKRNPIDRDGYFVIVSPKIIDTSEEQDFLKVFALSFGEGYKIYSDNTVYMDSGWSIPVAITYRKQSDGTYALQKYEMPQDGGGYADSIRSFCKTPVAGTEIKGLPERMMQSCDLGGNLNDHLREYLKKNGIENAKMMSG